MRVVFVLGLLLTMPFVAAATLRTFDDPYGNERTTLAGRSSELIECHAGSADILQGSIGTEAADIVLTLTLASEVRDTRMRCHGVLFSWEGSVESNAYTLSIGGPDPKSDRLWAGLSRNGDTLNEPCVQLIKMFEADDGDTYWNAARGCFGTVDVQGDRVVLRGPLNGTADFGSTPFPNILPFSVSPFSTGHFYAQGTRGQVTVSNLVYVPYSSPP